MHCDNAMCPYLKERKKERERNEILNNSSKLSFNQNSIQHKALSMYPRKNKEYMNGFSCAKQFELDTFFLACFYECSTLRI